MHRFTFKILFKRTFDKSLFNFHRPSGPTRGDLSSRSSAWPLGHDICFRASRNANLFDISPNRVRNCPERRRTWSFDDATPAPSPAPRGISGRDDGRSENGLRILWFFYFFWMQATGDAILVNRTTVVFVARITGEVLRFRRRVLNIATARGQHIESVKEDLNNWDPIYWFVHLVNYLGHTNPRSSTKRNRPWTEFRHTSLASFFAGIELLSLFVQISGCSRCTTNSVSPSSLNGPNWKEMVYGYLVKDY